MNVQTLLRQLRPPCARNAILVHGYAQDTFTNPGYTLRFPSITEPVVAMGDGRVLRVQPDQPFWKTAAGTLGGRTTVTVVVSHGQGLETTVSGLAAADVNEGMTVTRGQRLGLPRTLEVFFAIRLNGSAKHPAEVNRHFRPYDQRYVIGQTSTLRFAPDVLQRDLADGFLATVQAGWRYFYDLLSSRPYLVNVDFNGTGAKEGPAAAGIGADDYWTTYTPTSFSTSLDYTCGYGLIFSSAPLVWLRDHRGVRTAARIEKLTEPPAPFFGSQASWDPMLGTWIGGYSGLVPAESFFAVRGLPSGQLRVLLYASRGNATFLVSVSGGPVASQSIQPASVTDPAFVEGANYASFDVTLGVGGFLTVKAYGYLSGMQILRLGS